MEAEFAIPAKPEDLLKGQPGFLEPGQLVDLSALSEGQVAQHTEGRALALSHSSSTAVCVYE